MKTRWGNVWAIVLSIAFGVVFGLLAAGVVLLVTGPPLGEAISLSPPPTQSPLVVHVTGAVTHSGVYSLPRDTRIGDAIEAAGGILQDADVQSLNLAAFVQDGDRIWVPAKYQPQVTPTNAPPTAVQRIPGTQNPPAPTTVPVHERLININTASMLELESLPGVGPVIAQNTITYRQEHGPFTNIEAIQDVSGIGPVKFERIKDLITVESQP